jgi:hypothetical protein
MTYTTVYNPFTGEAFSTILHYLKDVYGLHSVVSPGLAVFAVTVTAVLLASNE